MCFSHCVRARCTVVNKTDVVIVLCAFCPVRKIVSDQEQQSSVKMLGEGKEGAAETQRRGSKIPNEGRAINKTLLGVGGRGTLEFGRQKNGL